jgi:LysM repeat protein
MYNENSNVLSKSNVTAYQLETAAKAMRANNGFNDFQAFINLETTFGINAVFALAHAAVESAWGTSLIATTKNNLFGFNAYDSDPGAASSYPSQDASIAFYGSFLKQNYLTPGGVDYNGTTIHEVFIKYSTSDTPANEAAGVAEDETIAGIMNTLVSHMTVATAPPVAAPTPVPTPATGNFSTIVEGDTFWGLESQHGWPHGTLADLNPGVNPDTLRIGSQIHIPGPAPHVNLTYVIKAGDTFWSLETAHGWAHGTLQGLNPKLNARDLQVGTTIILP